MSEDLRQIRTVLRAARRRWFWHTVLRSATRGLLSVSAVVALVWLILRVGGAASFASLAAVGGMAVVLLAAAAVWAAWPLRRRPTDQQVARFIEERVPYLEDRLVTAVECAGGPQAAASPVLVELLYRDAARRAADIDLDSTISRRALGRAARRAALSAAALIAVVLACWPLVSSSIGAARRFAFPPTVVLHVEPGNARVVAGRSFRIQARIVDGHPASSPVVTLRDTRGVTAVTMREVSPRVFAAVVPDVERDFRYAVSAQSTQSSLFDVKVLRPARVARIDVRYQYPPALRLAPRVERDGGDVFAPAGTRVTVEVHTDKAVRQGALSLEDGTRLPLSGREPRMLDGQFTISADGSYRVALTDGEGLTNDGDTEYFIRVLSDSPPDVRIVQPGTDRQVTPLEEVPIVAHAEDDHGVAGFELVYSVRGGPERSVPFATRGSAQQLDGTRTLYLEDLQVRPGDFVTYYARARDRAAAPGTTAGQARSDLFFLQVTPFDQEFVPPQSQAQGSAGGQGAGSASLDDLIRAQKAIVVATWKLDSRALRSRSAGSADDVRTLARAQGELRNRARAATGSSTALATLGPGNASSRAAAEGRDAMTNAIEAMGQAEQALNAVKTAQALPHETRALNELMRAQASQRRHQMMQVSAGAGSGADGANQDLSSMFDRELQRQQKTNYELPRDTPPRERQGSDALERLRQLAARQGELSQRQRDLERDRRQMDPDEVKRQLERLTREQSDLRQQAEQLAQQLRRQSQGGGTGTNQQRRAGAQESSAGRAQARTAGDRMREASEAMRQAAGRLREGKLGEANQQGQQALSKLQSAEQEMRGQQAGSSASSGRDGQRATDGLRRTQEIKDRLARLERRMADLQRQGTGDRKSQDKPGETGTGERPVGTSGREPGAGREATLARLREEYRRELQRAVDHLREMQRVGGPVGLTPEDQQAIHSAPGFHQDFSRWEQLSRGVNAGLERAESALAKRARDEQARDRLQAPSEARAPEAYRRLVEQYYQALAAKPRK